MALQPIAHYPDSYALICDAQLNSNQGHGFSSTGSSGTLLLANAWLNSCLEKHDGPCSSRSRQLPTRLIDVGPADGTKQPRLYETSDASERHGGYVALSYCWGSSRRVLTTIGIERRSGYPAGTYKNFKRAIDTALLPRTFQDAIQVTRSLGYRYLWIDALCII
jgi:Heterokaryon incompatibility protein (HET)